MVPVFTEGSRPTSEVWLYENVSVNAPSLVLTCPEEATDRPHNDREHEANKKEAIDEYRFQSDPVILHRENERSCDCKWEYTQCERRTGQRRILRGFGIDMFCEHIAEGDENEYRDQVIDDRGRLKFDCSAQNLSICNIVERRSIQKHTEPSILTGNADFQISKLCVIIEPPAGLNYFVDDLLTLRRHDDHQSDQVSDTKDAAP